MATILCIYMYNIITAYYYLTLKCSFVLRAETSHTAIDRKRHCSLNNLI